MNVRAVLAAGLVLVLAFAPGAMAVPAPTPQGDDPPDFNEVTLQGLSVGFGLLRLGAAARRPETAIAGYLVAVRPSAVTRVLVDRSSGLAFAYSVETVQLPSAWRTIRVDIRRASPGVDRELKDVEMCEGCPAARLLEGTPSRFPPTQIIRDGDVMAVELLVHPETGEKIVDILQFSTDTVSGPALDVVRDRLWQADRLVRRGDELAGKNDCEGAVSAYTEALALQADAGTQARLGACHDRLGRFEASRAAYERAVALNPADAASWHALGALQHRRGYADKAQGPYRKALKLRPDWAAARRDLGTAHLDRGELDKAFEAYLAARRAQPGILGRKDAVPARSAALQHYVFARVHAASGDVDAALGCLGKARAAGFTDFERARGDAEFAPFLDDPRFAPFLQADARS